MRADENIDRWAEELVYKISRDYPGILSQIKTNVENLAGTQTSVFHLIKEETDIILQISQLTRPLDPKSLIRFSFLMNEVIECALLGINAYEIRCKLKQAQHDNRNNNDNSVSALPRSAVEKIILTLLRSACDEAKSRSTTSISSFLCSLNRFESSTDQYAVAKISRCMVELGFPPEKFSRIDVIRSLRTIQEMGQIYFYG